MRQEEDFYLFIYLFWATRNTQIKISNKKRKENKE
jgi:hypothetical protein